MAAISGSVGLISGLPIGDLVDRLLATQQQPITQIDNRLKSIALLRTALVDLSARLLAVRTKAVAFSNADFFNATKAASSQESVLRATVSPGASPGEYAITVRQLASTHQLFGSGYASADHSYLSAGTLTIESAAARLDGSTPLAILRGGAGVRTGTIRITDRSGASTEIDLSTARRTEDVLSAINTQSRVAVRARVQGDAIVVDDTTGLQSGTLIIADVGAGHAATDLGIAGASASGRISGADVVSLSSGLQLAALNDGNGVRHGRLGADLRIHLADGSALEFDLSGRLTTTTSLAALNGGGGVAAGTIHISNRAGQSADVDLSTAQTVGDVLTAINASGLGITASVVRSSLVLTDSTQGAGATQVTDVNGGTTARDLGLASSSTNGTLSGTQVYRVETLGDVLNVINHDAANAGRVSLAISADGDALELTDHTTGVDPLRVEAVNGSGAAADLGLLGDAGGSVLRSGRLLGGLDTVLLRSLRGGQGIETGLLQLRDRAGATAQVDMTNAATLADVVDAINSAGTGIRVAVSDSGLGLVATDVSGGSGSLLIKDESGQAAAQLGINYSGTASVVRGPNLQRQYVSESTRLDAFDAGRGVARGRFRITNSAGVSAVVDLTQSDDVTVGDVINEVNSRGIGVTARINDQGDGILLTDTAGGPGRLAVSEDGGTTARSLHLLGAAAAGTSTIDGSLETRISVGPSDTLQTVLSRIQASSAGVSAAILNDGSQVGPYHLTLTSNRSGVVARLAVDGGTTGLSFSTLSRGRDAIVQVGGEDGGVALSSATNTIENAFPGGKLELISASSTPVTVTVSRDVEGIADKLSEFTDAFNAVLSRISDLSTFNSESGQRGVLLGDRSAEQVRSRLAGLLSYTVPGQAAGLNRLSSVGFSFSDGKLKFDSDKFNRAYAADPTGVANLFTQATTGLGARITTEINALTDSTTGALTQRNDSLTSTSDLLTSRKADLQALLERRRTALLAKFQAAEVALSRLQAQQNALGSLLASGTSLSTASNSLSRLST